MNGWIVQMYSKEPAVANACRYEAPCASCPDAKTPGVTEVASCATTSSFVQQMVPPTGTVIGFGKYW